MTGSPHDDLFALGPFTFSDRVLSRVGWAGFALALGAFLFDAALHEGPRAVYLLTVMGWFLTLASVPFYRNWLDVSVRERGLGVLGPFIAIVGSIASVLYYARVWKYVGE
jgi:small-conductance mechanosensitive channel